MSYKSIWDFGRGGTTNYSVHGVGEYPSKIRPIVIHHIVDRFSKKGDLVLDPFGGCGTVAIEAKLQGRNSISYDINKTAISLTKKKLEILNKKKMVDSYMELIADQKKEESGLAKDDRMGHIRTSKAIKKYKDCITDIRVNGMGKTNHVVKRTDARKLSLGDESVDSVITDIPYASMIQYSDDRSDLSRLENYDDFKVELSKALKEIVRVLKVGKYVVIFVADYRVAASRIIYPIHSDVIQQMLENGLELFDTYIWRYYRSGAFRPFGARPFQAMNLHTHILVFHKPTGMEDKKPNKAIHYRKRVLEKRMST
ncbi:MAG: DNA adenine methylase [Alphaproteobacteria bacterium]|nr:DNA adenine methylase [Alphaproteobacteria bacterium]